MPYTIKPIAPFDPADAGTPDARWTSALAAAAEWRPKTPGLLVVSPHPDDEVLGAGGLIHSWASMGRPVTIMSVTDGEGAFPDWHGLDLIRRDELKDALRKLSSNHVSVVRLGLPDGKVGQHANRLRNALLALLDGSITLIAPFERDGHPDHDAIGEVCVSLARTHGVPIARYPIWTWHHTDPDAFGEAPWARFPLSLEARRAKARAAECFASQLNPPGLAPIVPRHVLSHFERSYEAFLL
jgi:LmbE family N-acetylglucosaminyl deacetylase